MAEKLPQTKENAPLFASKYKKLTTFATVISPKRNTKVTQLFNPLNVKAT